MRAYNSATEKREQRQIRRLTRRKVVNPNGKLSHWGWFSLAKQMIDDCGMVVLSEYNDHIGRGVYDEIRYALKKGYAVEVLRAGKLYVVKERNVYKAYGPRASWVHYARVLGALQPYKGRK